MLWSNLRDSVAALHRPAAVDEPLALPGRAGVVQLPLPGKMIRVSSARQARSLKRSLCQMRRASVAMTPSVRFTCGEPSSGYRHGIITVRSEPSLTPGYNITPSRVNDYLHLHFTFRGTPTASGRGPAPTFVPTQGTWDWIRCALNAFGDLGSCGSCPGGRKTPKNRKNRGVPLRPDWESY